MEIFFNLVWALVAIGLVFIWIRIEPRRGAQRRLHLIALVMLLVILFPVISVSDDLWSIQNPAETDTCPRRDHFVSSLHSIFPNLQALPEPMFTQLHLGFSRVYAAVQGVSPVINDFLLIAIENRPPPVC